VSGHEHLRRLNTLLEQALALPENERERWLRTLPLEQQVFAPLLTSMLARASVETDTFMRAPVNLALDEDLVADHVGDEVGPYRLIRELGAGGMANVWLAERSDGTLKRTVALKLPRLGWALGLAQRMARERDILAALEHPNIARLYDAGVTAAGRPWLAMEYVDGVPLDVFCRAHGLDVAQRLQLFLQVTDAVAHAHARLVVHRDLKPTNILVTAHGDVRLLDFGVAKLLEGDDAQATHLTQVMGRAATPDYASPEQVGGRAVTVATDVYSLGVVLYELLTGVRPYRLGRPTAAALEEAILTADVPLASTRVADDPRLARRLRGDLDTVLAKALRKKPALRYASVESFAADVQRHLAGAPVEAQPPTRRYRAAKFVRRHRYALAAAGAVTAALFVGLGSALWQAKAARVEAARADEVKQFIASIFQRATPRQGVGGAVTAADLLESAGQRIERELVSQPRTAAELGVIVGEGFSALGEPQRGEAPLRAAVARAEREYGPRHPLTVHARALLVESLNAQDIAAAERLVAELVPDALAGLPATAADAVFALRSHSFVLAKRDRAEASYASLHQAIALAEKHLGREDRETVYAIGLLANTYGRFGDRPRQLAAATDALQRAQAAFGNARPHLTLTSIERWYGEALRATDRPADAIPVLRRVLQDQRALDSAETPRVRDAMSQLALALDASGESNEAIELLRRVVVLEAQHNTRVSEDRVSFGDQLAHVLTGARRADEALAEDERVRALRRQVGEEPAFNTMARDLRRARLLALRGDAQAATDLAHAVAQRAGDTDTTVRAEAWLVAALNERLQARPAAAAEHAQRAHATLLAAQARPGTLAAAAAELASARLDQGDAAQAEALLQQARDNYARAQVEPSIRSANYVVAMARVHLRNGRADAAEKLLLPLVAAWERTHAGSAFHGEALFWLARAQAGGNKADAARHRAKAAVMLRSSDLPALRTLNLR
jgi:serine/threonine-protein kinase